MLDRMTRRPFWQIVGLLMTSLQVSLIAMARGMPMEELETFIDENRVSLECISVVNGCAALFTFGGVVFVVAMHVAGVF